MTAVDQRYYIILTWRKTGDLRLLGHLDVARTIERAVRRAGLPVVYSKGFSPRAQISFASALPLGVAGENELCAIQLTERAPADQVREALTDQLPPDLGVVDVEVVSRPKRGIFSGLTVAEYRVEFAPEDALSLGELGDAVRRVVATESLLVTRKTKSGERELDVRPGIHALTVEELPDDLGTGPRLVMALAFESDRLVKPAEVLECIAREMTDSAAADAMLRPRRITRLGIY